MALPNPPQNPNTPIPNNPFSAPLNPFVCGPYFPVAVSAGIDMTTGATVPELINDVGNVLAAGPGIALNTFLGTTTITATGGGGGGIPCSTITGKGALVTGTAASTPVALAVGTDGYVLTACAACTEGLTWIASSGATPATPDAFGTLVGLVDTSANAGLGCFVLYNLTTGTDNVAIGDNALGANTSGSYNVAVGTYASSFNTTGEYNTAVGHNVFNSNTTGSFNNAFGLGTLGANTTGCYNNAFGWGALGVSLTGDSNTAIGNKAMALNNTGSFNTGIGEYSLCSIDSGCYNVGVGHCSGRNISTGCYNVAIGPDVEFANGGSSCQLSIGFSATCNWLTGDSSKNIQPGAGIRDCANSLGTAGQALLSTGTAVCWGAAGGVSAATPTVEGIVFGCTDSVGLNYGLGDGILSAITTGSLNIAIGAGALATTDTGTSNTAVGIGALFGNTTGVQNVALGQQTLFTSTTAGLNTAVGSQALQNTTGDANTALGNFAGNVLTTGCGNILVGNQAGGAGAGALDTGSNNVVIGNCISPVSNSGNCQLAIGAGTICWLTGTSTGAIKPGAGILDTLNSSGTAGQVLASSGLNQIQWQTINTFQTSGLSSNIVGGGGSVTLSFGPSLNSWNYVGVVYVTLNVVDTVTSAVYNYLYNGMMYADGSTPWTMSQLSAKTLDNSGGAFTVVLDFDAGYQYQARISVTNNSANQLSVNGNVNWANLSGDFA